MRDHQIYHADMGECAAVTVTVPGPIDVCLMRSRCSVGTVEVTQYRHRALLTLVGMVGDPGAPRE